jgi:cyclohexyl-isocyanide hydratase
MKIGMLLFPDLTQLDLTGPQEVFARLPGAEVLLVAATMDPVRSDHGLRLLPDVTREACPPLDLLFIPGGAGVNAVIQDDAWLDFIAAQGAQAKWVTSACTGSLALGAAGLLKGYKATTHWMNLAMLGPCGAIVTKERVVVDRNRLTGGGVTAGIDLALRVAAEVAGDETAKSIQLYIEYNPAPPFDAGHPDVAPEAMVGAMQEEKKDYLAWRLEMIESVVNRRQR